MNAITVHLQDINQLNEINNSFSSHDCICEAKVSGIKG